MKKFKMYLVMLVLSMLLPIRVSAQAVKGRLVDESNHPLPYANVVLLSLPDSAFVTGTISGEDGAFSLEATSENQILKISSIGYKTVYKPISPAHIGIVQLVSDAQMLGEVVVKANLPVTRIKNDALETNVQGTVLSKAGTAEDVLAHIPGLQKKTDGFEVLGKGAPLIYINGRKMRDAAELDQLSSEEISRVEVIRNPGAAYDATVGAVVRIRTVKRQGDGFGMNLRSFYDQSQNADFTEQIDMNYRHNSLDIFGMLSFEKTQNRQKDILEQTTWADTIWTQNNYQQSDLNYRGLDGRIGFNYDFSERHSVGVRYDLSTSLDNKMFTDFDSEVQADGKLYDILHSSIDSKATSKPEHQLNIYYAGQIGKGELAWDADYYSHRYNQLSVNAEESEEHSNRTVTSDNRVDNELFATKASFSHPLWGGSISVGGEYTYTDRHDDYVNPEGYVPTAFSRIREKNLAGFVQFSRPLPFGQANVGVRYEHVDFDYFESGNHIPGQSRVYDDFFPNVSLNAQIGKMQLMLSYAAKTQRPNYSQLRNNITYANRFTWQTGNPLLKPSTTHDITAVGVWRFLQAMVSYKVVQDYILYWGTQVEGQSATTLINYVNHHRLPSLTVMLAASPSIGIWNLNASAVLMKQWFSLEAAGQHRTYNNPLFVGSINNTFNLPAGFLFSADFSYQSCGQVQNITLKRPQYTLNLGLRKSFFNDALSVEARANDLLLGCKQEALLYMERAQMKDLSWSDTRSFSLTVRYKFNAAKSKYKGTGAGQDAINRM